VASSTTNVTVVDSPGEDAVADIRRQCRARPARPRVGVDEHVATGQLGHLEEWVADRRFAGVGERRDDVEVVVARLGGNVVEGNQIIEHQVGRAVAAAAAFDVVQRVARAGIDAVAESVPVDVGHENHDGVTRGLSKRHGIAADRDGRAQVV